MLRESKLGLFSWIMQIIFLLVSISESTANDLEKLNKAVSGCLFPEIPEFTNTNELSPYWNDRKENFRAKFFETLYEKFDLTDVQNKETLLELIDSGLQDELNLLYPNFSIPIHDQRNQAIILESQLKATQEQIEKFIINDLQEFGIKTKKQAAIDRNKANRFNRKEKAKRRAQQNRDNSPAQDFKNDETKTYEFSMSHYDDPNLNTKVFPPTSTDLTKQFSMTKLFKEEINALVKRMDDNVPNQKNSLVSKKGSKIKNEINHRLVNDLIGEVKFDIDEFLEHYTSHGGKNISATDLARIDNDYRIFILKQVKEKYPNADPKIMRLFERVIKPNDELLYSVQRELYKESFWFETAPEMASRNIAKNLQQKLGADLLEFFTFTRVNPNSSFNIKPRDAINNNQLNQLTLNRKEISLLNSEKDYISTSNNHMLIGEVKSYAGGPGETFDKIIDQIKNNGLLAKFLIKHEFVKTVEMRLHFPFYGLRESKELEKMREAAMEAGIKLNFDFD